MLLVILGTWDTPIAQTQKSLPLWRATFQRGWVGRCWGNTINIPSTLYIMLEVVRAKWRNGLESTWSGISVFFRLSQSERNAKKKKKNHMAIFYFKVHILTNVHNLDYVRLDFMKTIWCTSLTKFGEILKGQTFALICFRGQER